MSQIPVSQSPFDKVIKAASTIKTNNGLAALYLILGFLLMLSVLFLTAGIDRMILTILIFLIWTAFAALTVMKKSREESDINAPKKTQVRNSIQKQ